MKRLIKDCSNCRAVSLAEDFIDNPLKRILWIHGGNGYGKTELAKYLIQRFKDNNRIAYSFTMKDLIDLIVHMLRSHDPLTSLISCCQDYDLLVFDNANIALEGKSKTQELLKSLILDITKNGRTKVVLITNKKPRKLRHLMFDAQYCYYARLKIPTAGLKIDLLNEWLSQSKTFIPKNIITDIADLSKNLFQLKGLFNQINFKY